MLTREMHKVADRLIEGPAQETLDLRAGRGVHAPDAAGRLNKYASTLYLNGTLS